MIKEDYFQRDNRVSLDGSDIEMVDHQLRKIEKAKEACNAIASILTFLHTEPENAVKGMSECREKEIIEKILANTMREFTQSRGTTTRGLISMIEIISDTLFKVEDEITTTIMRGIEGSL